MLSHSELGELADLAVVAASEAGKMIAQSRPQQIQHKDGGATLASQVVTEIDRRSEDIIVDIVKPTCERFELGMLTEEQHDNGGRLTADYFWCIDPLDGTLPFIEGSPGYSVSIALVARDGTPWIGVIYDPVEATVVHAISGVGAFRDGSPWPIEPQPHGHMLSLFADRSFVENDDHDVLIDALGQIAQDMGLDGVQVNATGGAVINACRVLDLPPACYFKYPKPTGGGSLWDFAATACLFRERNAVASDMYGGRLDLNRADSTFMNHRGVLFATDQALAESIRAIRASDTR